MTALASVAQENTPEEKRERMKEQNIRKSASPRNAYIDEI